VGADGGFESRAGTAGSENVSEEESVWPEYTAPHWKHLVVNDRDLKVNNGSQYYRGSYVAIVGKSLNLSINRQSFDLI
jgi:hypothetical protein